MSGCCRSRKTGTGHEVVPDAIRIVLERLHDLVLVLEPQRTPGGETNDFRVIGAGAGAAGILGVPGESLCGGTLAKVLSGTRFPLSMGVCHQVAASGENHLYEDDYRPMDGVTKRFALRVSAVQGCLLVTADDVTEDRIKTTDLERFAALVDHGRSLVGFITPDLSRFYVNPAGRRLTGIQDDDPRAFLSRLPQAFRRRLREQILPDLVVKGYWSGEARIRHILTGQPMVLELNCFAVHDRATGRLLSHAAIARDITAVKRASRDLVRHAREVEAARGGSSDRPPSSPSRPRS